MKTYTSLEISENCIGEDDDKLLYLEDLLSWLENNFSMNGTGGDIYNQLEELRKR
jgi:hypothetical protein